MVSASQPLAINSGVGGEEKKIGRDQPVPKDEAKRSLKKKQGMRPSREEGTGRIFPSQQIRIKGM